MFFPAGAVMLWSLLAPIGAYVFLGSRIGWVWFAAYAVLATGSLGYDLLHRVPQLPPSEGITSGALALVLAILNVLAASAVVFGLLAFALTKLQHDQANVEQLLLNVLPVPIAERMRGGETAIADSFEEVTILFADVVGFTRLPASYPADQVVRLLNRIFTAFDRLAERWGAEKIKTIGDAYMVASGLPLARYDHAAVVAEVALAMRDEVEQIAADHRLPLELRIGVHTGPVVAGIIGLKKFAYDVWGDTVNVASRLESAAPPGGIRVSERTAHRLGSLYLLRRSDVPTALAGRGTMTTFLLEGRRPDRPKDAFPSPQPGTGANVVNISRAMGRHSS